MHPITQELEQLQKDFSQEAQDIADMQAFDALRIKYMSKKGLVAEKFKVMATLSGEERPIIGKHLNQMKAFVQNRLDELRTSLSDAGEKSAKIDLTLPGNRPVIGRMHPLMKVLEEIKTIFREMGFSIETGPEVETDFYNFEALNIPADHPSRDMQDSFYMPGERVLRTHTSPVQIRTMQKVQPPVRMIAPGRCFRRDTPDATHSPMFQQIEGLVVDEGVSMADLKGVLLAAMRKLLGEHIQIRFRPSFFPFTEPSAEYDITCSSCFGSGCRVCKQTGWLEISGAGMVDPAVFGFVDYDAEKYTGYAFGMGLERIAMIKYNIDDLRIFYENDVRFLTQF
ncbi:phenylalanine--tRNA ligase subunit alpha [candidate division KSB1 bacterium]|nr:phenylalanine--tRNA ligase subunit alpha [candidate division KSB1 bacterium]